MDYTSTIENSKSLAAQLRRDDPDAQHDDNWITMLEDHKNFIRAKGTIRTLTPEEQYQYQYRVTKLLKNCNGSDKSEIAFRIANNFRDNNDLCVGVSEVIIPSSSYVNELRRIYRTTRSLRVRAKDPSVR